MSSNDTAPMPPPPYRQYQTKRPDGSATYVEHDDGRHVMVGHKIDGIHYLDHRAAQQWVDRMDGAAGSWVTAEDMVRSESPVGSRGAPDE